MNPIGFSTGALSLGDFRAALAMLHDKPFAAVELSALRVHELPILLEAIPTLDLAQFSYVALHAPSLFDEKEENEIAAMLGTIKPEWKIVLHPDTIHDPDLWTAFGKKLVIENMDRRKADGRSAAELSCWFETLPDACFCLDLAHAQQWDPTLTEAYVLLKKFASRLCQVHISQLDSASHHYPLTESAIRTFSDLAWLIPPEVPFIIESRVVAEDIDAEVLSVERVISSTPTGAYPLFPTPKEETIAPSRCA